MPTTDFLARKNHKMHIAHLDRFGSVGRCAIFTSGSVKGRRTRPCYRASYQASHPVFPFGWSMCEIRFCISWPEKSQDAYRTSRPIPFGWSMCEIRFCISWPEKITRCISHISTDSVRLVDVRYSHQAVLKGVVLGRVKGRRTRPLIHYFSSADRCARFGFVFLGQKKSQDSRRQLTPVFDKPAFSRFSQIFQPRLMVHSFGKIVKRQV